MGYVLRGFEEFPDCLDDAVSAAKGKALVGGKCFP